MAPVFVRARRSGIGNGPDLTPMGAALTLTRRALGSGKVRMSPAAHCGDDGGVQEPSEPTWPPVRFHDRSGGDGWHAPPYVRVHARRLWSRGNGGPLRRDPDDRLGGGLAAGLGAWRGFSPTTVRIAWVVVALFTQGWAVPFYFIGWLVIPARGEPGAAAPSPWRHCSPCSCSCPVR
jgi:phage shock protein PspC (stress-responsive transcriptional regulator)